MTWTASLDYMGSEAVAMTASMAVRWVFVRKAELTFILVAILRRAGTRGNRLVLCSLAEDQADKSRQEHL